MAILILNRFPKHDIDYEEWFKDLNEELYMFGPEKAINSFNQIKVKKAFEKLYNDARVEFEAVNLYKKRSFDTIIALEESEIIRAGSLRSKLGLQGQSYNSALQFRNKILMKTAAQKAGIKVGEFSKISTPLDIYDFIEEHGLPIIIKPTQGIASINTVALHKLDDVYNWLKEGDWNNKMIEKYVEGDMYHVNGIVVNNEIKFICTFGCQNTCLSFTEGKGKGEWLLSHDNPLHIRLYSYTSELLKALDTPPITTFHLEIFHTPEDEIILCEIASRTSGGAVPSMIKKSFDLDMDRYIARAQCGIIDTLPRFDENKELTACYYIPPKYGKLLSYPKSCPFEWCVGYEKLGIIGKEYNGPIRSLDSYVTVIVKANSEELLLERLSSAVRYVEENTIWEVN